MINVCMMMNFIQEYQKILLEQLQNKEDGKNFEIDSLLDLKTQQNVLISGEGYTQEQLIKYKISHVGLDQLFGLKVYNVCDWEPGTIQFFPCSLLHSSSDHTRWNEEEFNTKYFLTGVLYDQRKHQTKSTKSTIGSQEKWTKKKWENKFPPAWS